MIILFYQIIFVSAAIQDANALDNKGNDYIAIDNSILGNLTNAREMMLKINAGQIDSYLYELLNANTLDSSKNIDDAYQFQSSMLFLNDLLQQRQDLGYELKASSALKFTTTLFGESNLDIGGYANKNQQIINTNTSGQSGAEAMFTTFLTSLRGKGNVFYVSDFVGKLDSGRSSNNYEYNPFTKNQLDAVPNYYDYNIPDLMNAINTTLFEKVSNLNTTYFTNTSLYLSTFSNITTQFQPFPLAIEDFGSIISAIDLTQPYASSVHNKLLETNATLVGINNQINELLNKTEVYRNELIGISDSIPQSASDYQSQVGNASLVNDLIIGQRNTYQNFRDAILNNLNIVGNLLPKQSYAVFRNVGLISAVINKETTIFRSQFQHSINSYTSIIDAVQTWSQILITLAVLISSFTAFELVRSFGKTQKNYSQMSRGNLKIKAKTKYSKNELGEIDQGFDRMVSEIRRILTAIQSSSERMAGISEELAAGSEEASASVQDVASTVREFSSGASEQNLLLNRVEEKLAEHLKAIEETSNRINETSSFVLKVAKRTNILGLNASIEAAKAGKFGRGFSIVAREVRNLSNETKRSAIEIADLIESIESRIRSTVREIQHEVSITKDVAENTAAGSEEASAATSEQVIMLSEISQTSNELSLLASELAEIVNQFQV